MFYPQLAHFHQKFLTKVCATAVIFIFTVQSILPSQVSAQSITQLNLPKPGSMIGETNAFAPLMLRGLTIDPKNPLEMDFIVNTGDTTLEGQELEQESLQLVRYFLAALTTPENELWVNLSPFEKDRIIPQTFGETEMGRDLLAQDYVLKQLTSSLMYPESELGQKFWDKVYAETQSRFGTSDIPLDTFNKVWILPKKAKVYEHGHSAFVVESELKVMLEEDFAAMQKSMGLETPVQATESGETASQMKQIIKEVIVPAIEHEVNHGEHFAKLRQIFSALILSYWYKQNLKNTLLSQIYVNQGKTEGVDVADKTVNLKIYDEYLQAFKAGAYDMIREDYDPAANEIVARKYFSGGVNVTGFEMLSVFGVIKMLGASDVADFMTNTGNDFIVSTALSTDSSYTASMGGVVLWLALGLFLVNKAMGKDRAMLNALTAEQMTSIVSAIEGKSSSWGDVKEANRMFYVRFTEQGAVFQNGDGENILNVEGLSSSAIRLFLSGIIHRPGWEVESGSFEGAYQYRFTQGNAQQEFNVFNGEGIDALTAEQMELVVSAIEEKSLSWGDAKEANRMFYVRFTERGALFQDSNGETILNLVGARESAVRLFLSGIIHRPGSQVEEGSFEGAYQYRFTQGNARQEFEALSKDVVSAVSQAMLSFGRPSGKAWLGAGSLGIVLVMNFGGWPALPLWAVPIVALWPWTPNVLRLLGFLKKKQETDAAMMEGRVNRVAGAMVAGRLTKEIFIKFSRFRSADDLWEKLIDGDQGYTILERIGTTESYRFSQEFRFNITRRNEIIGERQLNRSEWNYVETLYNRVFEIRKFKVGFDYFVKQQFGQIDAALPESEYFDFRRYVRNVVNNIVQQMDGEESPDKTKINRRLLQGFRAFIELNKASFDQWGYGFFKEIDGILMNASISTGTNFNEWISNETLEQPALRGIDLERAGNIHKSFLEEILAKDEIDYLEGMRVYIRGINAFSESLKRDYANQPEYLDFFSRISKTGFYNENYMAPFRAEYMVLISYLQTVDKNKLDNVMSRLVNDPRIQTNFMTMSSQELFGIYDEFAEELLRGFNIGSADLKRVLKTELQHHFYRAVLEDLTEKQNLPPVNLEIQGTDARDYHQSNWAVSYILKQILGSMKNLIRSGMRFWGFETAGGATTQSALLLARHGPEPMDPFYNSIEQTLLLKQELEKALKSFSLSDRDREALFDRYELKTEGERRILTDEELEVVLSRYENSEEEKNEVRRIYHIRQQMLFRGPYIVGMYPYVDEVVEIGVEEFYRFGVDVFRVFIADDDVREIKRVIDYAKTLNARGATVKVQPVVHFTRRFAQGNEGFSALMKDLREYAGDDDLLDAIVIKSAPGDVDPQQSYDLFKTYRSADSTTPVLFHSHATAGYQALSTLEAMRANGQQGTFITDGSFGRLPNGQQSFRTLTQLLRGTAWEGPLTMTDQKLTEAEVNVQKIDSSFKAPLEIPLDIIFLMEEAGLPGGMFSYFYNDGLPKKMNGFLPVFRRELGIDVNEYSENYDDFKMAFFRAVLKEMVYVVHDWNELSRVTPYSNWFGDQAIENVATMILQGRMKLTGEGKRMRLDFMDNVDRTKLGIEPYLRSRNNKETLAVSEVLANLMFVWFQDPFQMKYYPNMNLDLVARVYQDRMQKYESIMREVGAEVDFLLGHSLGRALKNLKNRDKILQEMRDSLEPFHNLARVLNAREVVPSSTDVHAIVKKSESSKPIVSLKTLYFINAYFSESAGKYLTNAAVVQDQKNIVSALKKLSTSSRVYKVSLTKKELEAMGVKWRKEQYLGMKKGNQELLLGLMFAGEAFNLFALRRFYQFLLSPDNVQLTDVEKKIIFTIFSDPSLRARSSLKLLKNLQLNSKEDSFEDIESQVRQQQLDSKDRQRIKKILILQGVEPGQIADDAMLHINVRSTVLFTMFFLLSTFRTQAQAQQSSMNTGFTPAQTEQAASAKDDKVGGIDLNPAMFESFDIEKDDSGMMTEINGMPISEIRSNIQGLHPFIIKITPMGNGAMLKLLGLNDAGQEPVADNAGDKPVYADQKFLISKES